MQIIGYTISGPDNGYRMFEDARHFDICTACGFRTNFQAHAPEFAIPAKRRLADLTYTYDGQCIASVKLIEALEEECPGDYHAYPVGDDARYFHLFPVRTVPFDIERRETRLLSFCSTCGFYDEVIGATPAFLKVDGPLAHGFYGSDILFASGNEKHPLLFISSDMKAIFKVRGLKGIDFQKVTD